jgi:SAM-dependent methyltransferase
MLYDLVMLRKALVENFVTDEVEQTIIKLQEQIDGIHRQVAVIDQQHQDYINEVVRHYSRVLESVRSPSAEFKKKIQEIDDQITAVSHDLFANNYDLEQFDGGVEGVRVNRHIHLRPEIEEHVRQRIVLYNSWQYPALEIGCRDGEWTQHLVSADPLYIMDKYQEFLNNTDSKFPAAYQRRLRKYKLNNYDFSVLPQGQFGFIFSWGHFNYVSLDTITQVLRGIMNLLRPGGVFMFSYNNGDTPAGAGMAESFAQTYIPQSILLPTCKSLGFEILHIVDEEPNISWVEIRRPGKLSTIKVAQVMGKVERRNI